jgi:hypothetical protein
MKDLLDQLGLSELFAHLFPGGILLSSLLLWVRPDELPFLLQAKEGWQYPASAAILLIAAYSVGLILSSLSSWLAAYAWRKWGRTNATPKWSQAWAALLALAGGVPRPVALSFVRANFNLSAALVRLTRLEGLTSLEVPWERLVSYRTIAGDRIGEKARATIHEADALHRRFEFAKAMALVGALLALQGLAQLLLGFVGWGEEALPPVRWGWLLGLVLVGFLSSWALRWAAGRCWEAELILTCSLVPLAEGARRTEVEARAYKKWLMRGKPDGSPDRDWQDAEAEVRREERGA